MKKSIFKKKEEEKKDYGHKFITISFKPEEHDLIIDLDLKRKNDNRSRSGQIKHYISEGIRRG